MPSAAISPEAPTFAPPAAEVERSKDMPALLRTSLEDYVALRAHVVQPRDIGDKPIVLDEAKERRVHDVLDAMAVNRDLLEDVGETSRDQERDQLPEPALTVCIPVEIAKEDPQRVVKTLKLVERSQKKIDKPVEVIIWDNARYKDEADKPAAEQGAAEKHASLKELVRPMNSDSLRIQTALQTLPESEGTISQWRSNYMDALAMQAQERGYGFDHPVLWLDADTTNISTNALAELEASVRQFDALLVHADSQHNMDWATGQPLDEVDDATKALVIDELQRRHDIRALSSIENGRNYVPAEYFEEHGLAFSLGAYLESGGLKGGRARTTHEATEESGTLIENFSTMHSRIKSLVSDETGSAVAVKKYLPNVRVAVSARRLHALAKRDGISRQVFQIPKGDYTLATDMADHVPDEQSQPISAEDLRARIHERAEGTYSYFHRSANWNDKFEQAQAIANDPDFARRQALGARVVERLLDRHFPADERSHG